jgi:protein TonB
MNMARRSLHTPAERKRALLLALIVHLALAIIMVLGLTVSDVPRAAKRLISFNVTNVEPDQPPPPPSPMNAASAAREAAAPPAPRAAPAPVMAPVPRVIIPRPAPVRVADELAALEGNAASAGAANSGAGSGAGGAGDGRGGGGNGGNGGGAGPGNGGIAAPARLLSGNLNRRDYGIIRSYGSPRGGAVLDLLVGAEGRLHDCRAVQSSGDAALDDRLCALLLRTAWEPARSPDGQPVPARLRYVANWNRN